MRRKYGSFKDTRLKETKFITDAIKASRYNFNCGEFAKEHDIDYHFVLRIFSYLIKNL